MESVAFVCFNHSNVYSGGRMHALILAMAFAKIGYHVDFYTNEKPVFYDDISDMYGVKNVRLCINQCFLWRVRRNDYRHIIFAPHIVKHIITDIVDNLFIYPFIKRLKVNACSKLWLIDFESPNWICNDIRNGRDMSAYKNLIKLIPSCDVILSTTKTGMNYAKSFYSLYNDSVIFKQLYLSINSKIADVIGYSNSRQNRAVVFYRSGQAHKNNDSIFNIVKTLPIGFRLLLIGRISKNDAKFLDRLKVEADKHKIDVEIYSNIAERNKFQILSESKILFFYSSFEGYGMPPVESQYVGTPVICSKLPVLIEVNKHAYFVDFNNMDELKDAVRIVTTSPISPRVLHDDMASIASIERFCDNLSQILNDIH